MPEPYHFDWHVDTEGYIIDRIDGHEYVLARGGPHRNHRPMEEHPGLWREFADTCTSPETILEFVSKYGLLDDRLSDHERGPDRERLGLIWGTATVMRSICKEFDAGDHAAAADLFSAQFAPRLRARIRRNDQRGRFEFVLAPETLRGALLLQAGEAITFGRKFRRCANCTRWFQLGSGAHTTRRIFCEDRCRVAFNRREKQGEGK